ncbi:MFS transporter [Oenococcus alcoholitolerans]|uniref:MFS transporter n=1 Tax=Oenococcus alcoholitolerans TaxID=931074 RepID=A0ABR4XS67_9LACO|nr:MFS transporter [Oenococcus alcoholitolerans]
MKNRNNLIVLILMIGVFGILNTEMGIVGIIPLIARVFSVSVPTAGFLVSGFALVVVFAGPTMPLVFAKVNRKTAMPLALGIFVIANLVSALTSNFGLLLAARIIPVVFHALYISMAFSVAAELAEPGQEARASSRIFIGVSAGMVLGVPITNLIAHSISFSAAMFFFMAVNAFSFIATLIFVPSIPVENAISSGQQVSVLKKPEMIRALFIVIFLNGSIFGFYSFLSDFLEKITGLTPPSVSSSLLIYGIANIIGNFAAGRALAENDKATVKILPFALMISYLLLFFFGSFNLLSFVWVTFIGFFAGINSNMNQYIVTQAGKEATVFSNGMYLTAANLGTTVGTYICGLFIDSIGTRYSLFGTFIFIILGLVFILFRRKEA